MIKNVLLCGLGAVGCVYADKINKYKGADFRILVNESRLKRYSKQPMRLNKNVLNLRYILPESDDFKADLIIITTKFDGLKEVIDDIENFVKDDTIIISLLNGVTSEKIIAEKYGWNKLLFSYWIGHSAMRDGSDVTHDGTGKIVFGAKEGITPNAEKLKTFFDKANIEYEIPEDIQHKMWLKFMLNVSTNQPSAIYKATFGDMQNNPEYKGIIKHLMEEVQKVATAQGIKNTETMIDEASETLMKMLPEGKTSMLQDVLAQRKTEVDIFAGTIIELGKKYNIPVPYNQMMKREIKKIEKEYNTIKR